MSVAEYGLREAKAGNSKDEPEEEEDVKTPMGELSEFCDYTSTHGPNHIKRVGPAFGKALWGIVTSLFSLVLIWQITLLFMRFINFEYNVLIDVQFDRQLLFPAITICNLNAFR